MRMTGTRTKAYFAFFAYFAALFGCAGAARAQVAPLDTVNFTVTDPCGIPYGGGQITAQLVPQQPYFTSNGAQWAGSAQSGPATLTAAGSGTMSLVNNPSLFLANGSPGGSQWMFTVTDNGSPPPAGTGPQQFTATITINANPQSISAALSALAPQLIPQCGGAPGTGTVGVTAPNTLTCLQKAATLGTSPKMTLTDSGVCDSGTIVSVAEATQIFGLTQIFDPLHVSGGPSGFDAYNYTAGNSTYFTDTCSGTVAIGATSCTLAALPTLANIFAGQGIHLFGLGVSGQDEVSIIVSVNYTSGLVTWVTPTSTAGTNPVVARDDTLALQSALTAAANANSFLQLDCQTFYQIGYPLFDLSPTGSATMNPTPPGIHFCPGPATPAFNDQVQALAGKPIRCSSCIVAQGNLFQSNVSAITPPTTGALPFVNSGTLVAALPFPFPNAVTRIVGTLWNVGNGGTNDYPTQGGTFGTAAGTNCTTTSPCPAAAPVANALDGSFDFQFTSGTAFTFQSPYGGEANLGPIYPQAGGGIGYINWPAVFWNAYQGASPYANIPAAPDFLGGGIIDATCGFGATDCKNQYRYYYDTGEPGVIAQPFVSVTTSAGVATMTCATGFTPNTCASYTGTFAGDLDIPRISIADVYSSAGGCSPVQGVFSVITPPSVGSPNTMTFNVGSGPYGGGTWCATTNAGYWQPMGAQTLAALIALRNPFQGRIQDFGGYGFKNGVGILFDAVDEYDESQWTKIDDYWLQTGQGCIEAAGSSSDLRPQNGYCDPADTPGSVMYDLGFRTLGYQVSEGSFFDALQHNDGQIGWASQTASGFVIRGKPQENTFQRGYTNAASIIADNTLASLVPGPFTYGTVCTGDGNAGASWEYNQAGFATAGGNKGCSGNDFIDPLVTGVSGALYYFGPFSSTAQISPFPGSQYPANTKGKYTAVSHVGPLVSITLGVAPSPQLAPGGLLCTFEGDTTGITSAIWGCYILTAANGLTAYYNVPGVTGNETGTTSGTACTGSFAVPVGPCTTWHQPRDIQVTAANVAAGNIVVPNALPSAFLGAVHDTPGIWGDIDMPQQPGFKAFDGVCYNLYGEANPQLCTETQATNTVMAYSFANEQIGSAVAGMPFLLEPNIGQVVVGFGASGSLQTSPLTEPTNAQTGQAIILPAMIADTW